MIWSRPNRIFKPWSTALVSWTPKDVLIIVSAGIVGAVLGAAVRLSRLSQEHKVLLTAGLAQGRWLLW